MCKLYFHTVYFKKLSSPNGPCYTFRVVAFIVNKFNYTLYSKCTNHIPCSYWKCNCHQESDEMKNITTRLEVIPNSADIVGQ